MNHPYRLADLQAEALRRSREQNLSYRDALNQMAKDGTAPIAQKPWMILALVRVTTAHRSQAPDNPRLGQFQEGEVRELIQMGHSGEPEVPRVWWSNLDVGTASILPAEYAEVIDVIADNSAPLTRDQAIARLGPEVGHWIDNGVAVVEDLHELRVLRASDGRQVGRFPIKYQRNLERYEVSAQNWEWAKRTAPADPVDIWLDRQEVALGRWLRSSNKPNRKRLIERLELAGEERERGDDRALSSLIDELMYGILPSSSPQQKGTPA